MKFTPQEIAELLKERPNQPGYIEGLVRRAVNEAVAAEREACLEIADACADADMHASMAENCIRARGQQ